MSEERRKQTDPNWPRAGTTTVDDIHADANRDPLSGEPGAHPVGTGLGAAAGGAAAGAAGGAMGGPVGAVVGAVVGGIAGGLAGKGISESIDPTVEGEYWRGTYATRPYYDPATPYEEYEPAYRYGWESRVRHADRKWDEVESDLARNWDAVKAHSRLNWERARHATRDAWDRIENSVSDSGGHEHVDSGTEPSSTAGLRAGTRARNVGGSSTDTL